MKIANVLFLLIAFASTAASGAQVKKPTAPSGASHKTRVKIAPPPVLTASGLQYIDLIVGTGPVPKEGETVVVHYTGWLTNGKKFDSSVDRKLPFEFVLGRGQVIKGWDEGVASMHVGGKRKLTIPPQIAYGAQGYPGVIPPNSTLVFEVRLLKIK